jgi:hypothetical protein
MPKAYLFNFNQGSSIVFGIYEENIVYGLPD